MCGNDELVEYNAENTYTRRSRKDGKTLEVFTFGDNPNFGLAFNKGNLRYNMATNMFIKDNDGSIISVVFANQEEKRLGLVVSAANDIIFINEEEYKVKINGYKEFLKKDQAIRLAVSYAENELVPYIDYLN